MNLTAVVVFDGGYRLEWDHRLSIVAFKILINYSGPAATHPFGC